MVTDTKLGCLATQGYFRGDNKIMPIKSFLEKQVNRIAPEFRMSWQKVILLAIFSNVMLSAHSVHGQTLEEALTNAYQTNPFLQAARAELRATDETVNQAISGWRPSVEFSGTAGVSRVETNFDLGDGSRKPRSGELSVKQNLYAGGQTTAETEQKQYDVLWKRAVLVRVEQNVLLDASIAYMDTVRDQAVVDLRKNNKRVLLRQLEATKDRFSVGEVTRTDVSQAEARVARAKADEIQAEGDFQNSRTIFERVVGFSAVDLASPSITLDLPKTQTEAIELALKRNPNVLSALYVGKAAKKKIQKIKGELLPSLDVIGSISNSRDVSSRGSSSETSQIIATLKIPLYQQGAVSSRVRAAKQEAAQRRFEYDDTQRISIEATKTAWKNLETAKARMDAFRVEIKSSEIALEGVRQEANVGSRTVLDVLDAEQELLDAQVKLVRAERDEFVAAAELAASVGKLTAKDYNLKIDYYDELKHYNKVRDKFYGSDK